MYESETVSIYSSFDSSTATVLHKDDSGFYSNDVLVYLPKVYFLLHLFLVLWCFKQIALFFWAIFKEYIF